MARIDCHELIELLLYFASHKGKRRMIFEWEMLTMEIAAALCCYLTGRTDIPDRFFRSEFRAFGNFQDEFNGWLNELLDAHGSKINPGLREAFREMLTIDWQNKVGPSDGYNRNEVREWYFAMIGVYNNFRRTFAFSVEHIGAIERRMSQDFGEETINHCEAIAALMNGYIERDYAFLKEHHTY